MRIGVTGASGYIGLAVLARLENPVVLGRRPLGGHNFRPMTLDEPFDPALLAGLDGVIHLAANTSGALGTYDHEVRFAKAMAAEAQQRGIPLVVASSQVASAQAPSAYGRTKAAIEAAVLPLGARVVRPGLVYGGAGRGLFGQLLGLVRGSPVLPWLISAPRVQPVHVDDVGRALVAALHAPLGRAYLVAGPPVGFSAFLREIARVRLGRPRLFLPVPVTALRLVLRLGGPLLGPRMAPERFDSLLSVPVSDGSDDAALLGVEHRPIRAGLTRSGRMRQLRLREGLRMMEAVVGAKVQCSVTRRYALALERMGVADAPYAGWGRWRLQAVDRVRRQTPGSAAWRTGIAARVAEATPWLAARFIRRRAGRWAATVELVEAVVVEVRSRVLRPFARELQ